MKISCLNLEIMRIDPGTRAVNEVRTSALTLQKEFLNGINGKVKSYIFCLLLNPKEVYFRGGTNSKTARFWEIIQYDLII